MRSYLVLGAVLALTGCGSAMPQKAVKSSTVASATSPGRVVVYRNGVAYVERFADVENGTLSLAVARDKVDDLLKSLTAVDVATGESVPVSYSSTAGEKDDHLITLQVGGAQKGKRRLRLTYLSGAPAWKPSYRVVVGKTGEVSLEAWAIVDNASGEDWRDVRLGVGASSAMSFRYDLQGLRVVDRDTLADKQQFAQSARVNNGGKAQPVAAPTPGAAPPASNEPIGTSHFESPTPMTVPTGTSAMVSILRSSTEGEVVYLYDPLNAKTDARFPLRTIRFRNPSDGALESGPLSVFGEGRYVGEGLAEQVAAKSIAFVPFALDRQITVDQKIGTKNQIARIVGVNHGVFTADQTHTQTKTYTVANRMGEKATVYLKHQVTPGFKLSKFPDTRSPAPGASDSSDHLADLSLFKVDLEPNSTVNVEVEESIIQRRVTDIRSAGELELVRNYLQSPEGSTNASLKSHIDQLLKVTGEMAKTEDRINVEQAQLEEARTRIEEIKTQLATLKSVKSGGALATTLEKKLAELSSQVGKQTVELVRDQQQLAVAQVELQTAVADTTLEGSAPPPVTNVFSSVPPASRIKQTTIKHPHPIQNDFAMP